MRICAINGSLRSKQGVSRKLLDALERGVQRAGESWEPVHLATLKIETYRACNHCQKLHTFRCVYDDRDDTARVFNSMSRADILVYASPVYVFGISSRFQAIDDTSATRLARAIPRPGRARILRGIGGAPSFAGRGDDLPRPDGGDTGIGETGCGVAGRQIQRDEAPLAVFGANGGLRSSCLRGGRQRR